MNANDAKLTDLTTAPTEDMGPGHRDQFRVRCTSTQMMPYSSRDDNEPVRIREARVSELPFLQTVDRAAGRMFGDVGMPEIADHHW